MDKVDAVDDENPTVNFSFKFSKPSGRHVVTMKNITKSYPNVPIVKETEGLIEKGDKIALIGANGRGKSTLLRIIAGADSEFKGNLEYGHNVTKTFFAQHQLEALHLENEILQELQAFAPKHTETELRSILGSFLFTGDDAFKKIKVLSGGEKSRVALAKTLTADANFLLLDEPTNHLDIQSINILIQALRQYEGTFILVSHDRYLLDNVANKIWYIEDQKIKQYPGTYQEYEEWQSKRVLVETPKKEAKHEKEVKPKKEKKVTNENDSDKRNKINKVGKLITQIESNIFQLENELKTLEDKLSDSSIYQNEKELAEVNKQYAELKQALKDEQKEWDIYAEELMLLEE